MVAVCPNSVARRFRLNDGFVLEAGMPRPVGQETTFRTLPVVFEFIDFGICPITTTGETRQAERLPADTDAPGSPFRHQRRRHCPAAVSGDPDRLKVAEFPDALHRELAAVSGSLYATERQFGVRNRHTVHEYRTGLDATLGGSISSGSLLQNADPSPKSLLLATAKASSKEFTR